MKTFVVGLLLLLAILQYKLWFEPTGLNQYRQLKEAVTAQSTQNKQLQQRNQALAAEIKDLKHGREAIEERARHELGLVKNCETYYQIVE